MATNHTNAHEWNPFIRVSSCPSWLTYFLLAAILLASLFLHFNHLGHPGVKDLDEAYHAIVARSMLDDPLKPTLYATPYLPYDFRNWQSNHVWLHKPPVALWQIAGSFAVLGESNFTLRLPSALLASAAVLLTFLIGRSLFTAEAGLVAAFLQAMSPAITRLVHGQVFSDHVDVAMLFWCELAVFLLIRAARSGRTSDAALVGVAQAIAWMTKSYPALFVSGLAVVLFVIHLSSRRRGPSLAGLSFSIRQLLVFFGAALICAVPWITLCLIRYPHEFLFEQAHVFQHLYRNVEEFRAPWDRLLADYLQRGFVEWYALIIVAVFLVSFDAIRSRDVRKIFLAAWAWGVLIPHLLATSKTPTATLIGWPAGWIAVGVLVSEAIHRRCFAIGAVVAGLILLLVFPQFPHESVMGYGTDYHFGSIAIGQWRIGASVVLILLAGAIAHACTHGASKSTAHRPAYSMSAIALLVLALFPVVRHTRLAIRTSQDVPSDPIAFEQLGKFVRAKSPLNAVFLVDDQIRGEHILAMWWLDRACYPLHEATLADDVATIVQNGGEPFILSRAPRPEWELPGVTGEAHLYVPRTLKATTVP